MKQEIIQHRDDLVQSHENVTENLKKWYYLKAYKLGRTPVHMKLSRQCSKNQNMGMLNSLINLQMRSK